MNNILFILPLCVEFLPNKLKIQILGIIGALQMAIFLLFKEPNCYDIQCPEIKENRERQLLYEKYQRIDDDINTLRSPIFMQAQIFDALNIQICIFLLAQSMSLSKQYKNTMTSILYCILISFSINMQLLMTNELYALKLPYFEIIQLLRILELTIIFIIREIQSKLYEMPSDFIRKQLKKKEISQEEGEEIKEIADYLNKEPNPSIFSTKNLMRVLSVICVLSIWRL